MSVVKSYILNTPEQCLTLNTFIKNLPPNEKFYFINLCPNGYEVLVLVEEKIKPETEIIVTARNYNIIRLRDALNSGLGGSMYST